MVKALAFMALAAAMLICAPQASAQRSTEMYIPIGQSPGLSGKFTNVGRIDSLDLKEGSMTCSYDSRKFSVRISDRTKIWLDRSKLKVSNAAGSIAECAKGRWVEIKYIDNVQKDGAEAEWIKIRIESSSGK